MWVTIHYFSCLPLKITVPAAVMWTKPVHKDPEFKILMTAPVCFQGAEKPEKAQCSQMQKHLLFQHLRAHFSFYDPFGKQCLLQRTKIILPSGTPRHGSGPRSKSPAPDLRDVGKLNEGDMFCHARNTPLGSAVRQQPRSEPGAAAQFWLIPLASTVTTLPAHHPTPTGLENPS